MAENWKDPRRGPLDVRSRGSSVLKGQPGGGLPGTAPAGGPQTDPSLLRASWRQGAFINFPFVVGTVPILLRPFEPRTYLIVQNLAPGGSMYFGFGTTPTINSGLKLNPDDAYEPWTIPVNEVWVIGTVANMRGLMIFATESI